MENACADTEKIRYRRPIALTWDALMTRKSKPRSSGPKAGPPDYKIRAKLQAFGGVIATEEALRLIAER
jgi:hypothetical protein